MKNYSIDIDEYTNNGQLLDDLLKTVLDVKRCYAVTPPSVVIEHDKSTSESKTPPPSYTQTAAQLEILKQFTLVCECFDATHVPAYNGIPAIIFTPDYAPYRQAATQLEMKGYEQNKTFFQGEVFIQVYQTIAQNKRGLDYVEFMITERCSLKCRDCSLFIPYYKDPVHVSKEVLFEDFRLFFTNIDFVHSVRLLGGEPLLHPAFEEVLDELCQNYRDKIESLYIVTNATVPFSKRLLVLAQRYKVTVHISNYAKHASCGRKVQKLQQTLDTVGVTYTCQSENRKWMSVGFPNNIRQTHEDQLSQHYRSCANHCRSFYNGRLYFCSICLSAIRAGLWEEEENDSFDFRKPFSAMELLKYNLGFCKKGYLSLCHVCNGTSDESNGLYIEPAIQL